MFGKGPHVGKSGKYYSNPHVMQAKGDESGEHEAMGESKGHPKGIHGHFHEDGTAHTHIHHSDDTHEHMDHGSHEEAHDHMNSMMGMATDDSPAEEQAEEHPMMNHAVGKTGGGAY